LDGVPVLLHWTPAKGLLVPLSKLPTNDSRPAIAATIPVAALLCDADPALLDAVTVTVSLSC
jgi:hypothetical protein